MSAYLALLIFGTVGFLLLGWALAASIDEYVAESRRTEADRRAMLARRIEKARKTYWGE